MYIGTIATDKSNFNFQKLLKFIKSIYIIQMNGCHEKMI